MRALLLGSSSQDEHAAAIVSIAEKMGCSGDALRKWVRQAERDTGQRTVLKISGRQLGEEGCLG